MGINIPYAGSKLNVRDRMRAEARLCDSETEYIWLHRFIEIAMNGIKWKGLPPEIDARFLELTLLFCGKALFFRDPDAGFAVWRFTPVGKYNHYRDPRRRRALPEMGNTYNRILTEDDSVIIYNNMTRTPDIVALRYYTRKMAATDRAIDVNIAVQKTPKMVICDERQRMTFENLIAQYTGNLPFIFGAKSLQELGHIEVLDTSAPFVAPELAAIKRQQFAEALTYWGIENSSSEKKERLVSDEVTSNLGAVEIARECRLNARRQAADAINRMFADYLTEPVTVEFNAPETEIKIQDPGIDTADEEVDIYE